MAKDIDGLFVLALDGKEFRTIVSYIAENLDTGRFYRFKVSAYNFNGEGLASAEMTTYSCSSPSIMEKPLRVTSSPTSFTIQWQEPADDGGCPITGYAVFRDDGASGPITTEVNSDSDTNVRDKPTLRELIITNYESADVGKTFVYQIQAFNVVRSSLSDTSSYIFGSVPPAPTQAVTDDQTVTSSELIRVTYPELTDLADIGGSTILSYNLQVDDGAADFVDVHGYD